MTALKVLSSGRKRKPGARTRSGRLSRSQSSKRRADDRLGLALRQRARLGATSENALNPRWGTPWGRLALQGEISEREYAAAEKYHRVLIDGRRAAGARKAWASSAGWTNVGVEQLPSQSKYDDAMDVLRRRRYAVARRQLSAASRP